MSNDKRAADDAEREQLELIVRCDPTWLLMDVKNNTHFDAALLEKVFELAKEQARAALSSRADGGKGEEDKPTCPHCGLTDIEYSRTCHNSACSAYAREESFYRGWQDAAPQAECAPREAQPVGPRTTLNYDGTFDTTCAHCGGNGCFACLKSAAPTPERADADTAGASERDALKQKGLDDHLRRLQQDGMKSEEDVRPHGWKGNPDLTASQERADAGKDAALKQALDALKQGKQFIVNGVEFGFIRMPEPGDPALYTLPTINAAIDAILAANKEPK